MEDAASDYDSALSTNAVSAAASAAENNIIDADHFSGSVGGVVDADHFSAAAAAAVVMMKEESVAATNRSLDARDGGSVESFEEVAIGRLLSDFLGSCSKAEAIKQVCLPFICSFVRSFVH